jgi:hypothetical protein
LLTPALSSKERPFLFAADERRLTQINADPIYSHSQEFSRNAMPLLDKPVPRGGTLRSQSGITFENSYILD